MDKLIYSGIMSLDGFPITPPRSTSRAVDWTIVLERFAKAATSEG